MSFYVSTATFFLLHCDEWDRVVALPRHKFVTGATLLQLIYTVKRIHVFYRKNPSYFLIHDLSPECNKSKMRCDICGAGTVYPSGTPEFTPAFCRVCDHLMTMGISLVS